MNKKNYLVTKDEFNRKAIKLPIFISYVCKYHASMVAKVETFLYVGINFYIDGEYVEFLVDNDEAIIKWVEENFIGSWAE